MKRFLSAALALILALAPVSACAAGLDDARYAIGIVVYDPDNAEMAMFLDYYREYITTGFPVKFFVSSRVSSPEEENDFIRAAAAAGAQGIISFYGQDVERTVPVCEACGVYYVLGSGAISDEKFDAVKDNPWFLGSIGPAPDSEALAGRRMAEDFLKQGRRDWLIATGGASAGNYMHLSRAAGMLEALRDGAGLIYEGDAADVAASEACVSLTNADGSLRVTLCPGYTSTGVGQESVRSAMASGDCDALLSVFYASDFAGAVAEKEAAQSADIRVGAVDCFSDENFEVVRSSDAFGNPRIDFIEGKYASMAGPAFAVMMNAITGHPEANSADGGAVRLYQGFWEAADRETFIELYGYTQDIYENAYSCADLMRVIAVYSEEASPERLCALTEAYTVEDVKARIFAG